MSNENIRLTISAISELPTVNAQLLELINLTKQAQAVSDTYAKQAAFARGDELQAIKGVQTAVTNLSSAQKTAGDASKESTGKASDGLRGLENQVRSFQSLVVAAFSLNEIKGFAMDVIDAKTKIDSIKIALDTMIGSKRESTQLFGEIVQLAKTSPFSLNELAEQTAKLTAYGIETKKIVPTMEALGNMAAAVGKEKLPQLTLAYGQIMNMGRLLGTETRQMVEAGVDLYGLLAKSMDKPKEEVIALAQAHKIMASDVEKAIMQASDVGGQYFGLMKNQAQTLGGQVSNLGDQFFTTKGRIGDFFENGIKGGIKLLGDLMNALTGSDGALRRTVSSVTAAVSAWVAARTALNLLNAQTLINAGASDQLTTSQRLLTMNSGTMSAAFGVATGGLRALWAAFSANPIGALITGVTLLISAWEAWDAVNQKTTESIGQQEYDLQREQLELGGLVKSVYAASEGTERRKEAIDLLITKYPDYFSGLDREKTTNAELRGILEKVNLSYSDRIDLAREAYRLDGLADQQKGLLQKEKDLFERVRNANVINEEVMLSLGGNSRKLMEYLKENPAIYAELNSATVSFLHGRHDLTAQLIGEFDTLEKNYQTTTTNIQTLRKTGQESELAALKAHHNTLMGQLENGSQAEVAEVKRYEAELAGLKGDGRKKEVKAVVDHGETMKQISVFNLKEINAILKTEYQNGFKDHMAALDAQEKAEIDAANKRLVSKKAGLGAEKQFEEEVRAQFIAIHEKYEVQREKLRKDAIALFGNDKKREVDLEADSVEAMKILNSIHGKNWKETQDKREKDAKDAAEKIKDSEKLIQDSREETKKSYVEAAAIEKQTRQDTLQGLTGLADQLGGIEGQILSIGLRGFQAIDGLSGKIQKDAKDNLAAAQENLKLVSSWVYENSQQQTQAIAQASAGVAKAEETSAKAHSGGVAKALAYLGFIISIAQQLDGMIAASEAARYKAIDETLTKTRDIFREFYTSMIANAKEAYGQELSNFKGTYDQKKELITQFYAQQNALMTARNGIDAQLAYTQDILNAQAQLRDNVMGGLAAMAAAEQNKIKAGLKYQLEAIAQQKAQLKDQHDAEIANLTDLLQKFKDAEDAKIQKVKDSTDKQKEYENETHDIIITNLGVTMDYVRAKRDKMLADVKEAADIQKALAKEVYDDAVGKIKAEYELKQQTLSQTMSDQAEAASILQRIRNEELDHYERDETKKLTATRDRILASLTDEGEKAQVTAAFEKKLFDLHAEVEAGKLDASKGASLAQKQLKLEETEYSKKLKAEETDKLAKLDAEYKAKIDALDAQRKIDLDKAAAYGLALEKETKALIEAENERHKAEIDRIERVSSDKIKAIQEELKQYQAQINAQKLALDQAYSAAQMDLKRQEFRLERDMKIADLLAKYADLKSQLKTFLPGNSNQPLYEAMDAINEAIKMLKAIPLASGSAFVDAPGAPEGRDAIPAMLMKGERVIPTALNRQLGGISNNELVARLMMPRVAMPTLPVRLNLPLRSDAANPDNAMLLELQLLRKELREKQLLAIDINEAGISKALIAENNKTILHGNKLQF